MTPITKKIGILGTGQLGRMLAMAGLKLGQKLLFCSGIEDRVSQMDNFQECDDLKELANFADVVTFESENVPLDWLEEINLSTKVLPSIRSLSYCQHRGKEKDLFRQLQIPTPAYRVVRSMAELITAVTTMGLPIVLKTTTGGYDGKGQIVVHDEDELATAWYKLNVDEAIVEVLVNFRTEVSIIAARDRKGNIKFYPVAINMHAEGILRLTLVSKLLGAQYQLQAEAYIKSILEYLDYTGIMTLELFVTKHNKLIANEIAPRVHNSGHWTLEGAVTSQFENHIRSIADVELGDTRMFKANALMVNLIGKYGELTPILKNAQITCHLYDKEERINRKIGHITCIFDDFLELQQCWDEITTFLPVEVKEHFATQYLDFKIKS